MTHHWRRERFRLSQQCPQDKWHTTVRNVQHGGERRRSPVLPETKADAAVNFAKRQRTDLQKFVLNRVKLMHLPMFEIVLDKSGQVYDKLYGIKK